jgi:hypothetical protein
MARPAIPGLEVDESGVRSPRFTNAARPTINVAPDGTAGVDPGYAEATRRGANTPFGQSPNNPTFHGDGRYGAPPNPEMGGAARPQPVGQAQEAWRSLRGGAGKFAGAANDAFEASRAGVNGLRSAGAATGDAIGSAGKFVGSNLGTAGKAVGKLATSNLALAGAATVLPHTSFYGDSGVPFMDKARVGVRDAAETLGAVGGGIFGAGVGSRAGSVGALAGGLGGAVGGAHLGRWATGWTGADDALRRGGYNPDANIIDTATGVAKRMSNGEGVVDALTHATGPTSGPGARGNFAGQGIPTGTDLAPSEISAPVNPQDQHLAAGAYGNGAGDPRGLSAPAPNPNGTITRDGNSYTGAPGIKYGADIANPNGSIRGGRGTVTSMPNGDPGIEARTAAIEARNHELRLEMQHSGAPTPGVSGSMNPNSSGGENIDARNARMASTYTPFGNSGMRPRDLRHAQSVAAERSIAANRERGEMGRAQLSADTQLAANAQQIGMGLRGQDMQRQSSLEGHDVQREGHQLTAASNRARLGYEFGKDRRDFTAAQAERDRTATEASTKSWQSMAESRYRTRDGDGKDVPDHQKIAMFNTATDATIPSMIRILQQTGSPEAMKKAQDLSQRGRSALEPGDLEFIQKALEKRETARGAHGILPGTGNFVGSDDLTNYMTAGNDTGALGNRVDVSRNGTRTPSAKLIYGPNGNVFLPNFQPPNTNLTNLGVR